MKTIFSLALVLCSLSVFADEDCQFKIGLDEKYSVESKDGGLAAADSKKFKVTYWDNNEQYTLKDAKVKIIKVSKFHEELKTGNNGMGERWTNRVTDYAVRLQVKTTETELYPRMMGRPGLKEITVSTICTSIVKAK